jgi:3-hydroxybutyryl-CoA dehydrogenase
MSSELQIDRQRIVVVGSGLMGAGIGQSFATAGFRVSLVDLNQELLELARDKIRKSLDSLRAVGLVSNSSEAILQRIQLETDLEEAAGEATFVEEAIFEDLAAKKKIFGVLDKASPKDCILATNTSSIPITRIAADCLNPDRVLGAHFWNPPHLIEAVEVVRGEKTADETIARAVSILKKAGKKPAIVRKDMPGQIGIRILYSMIREATYLVEDGVASPEDIDTIVKEALGTRLEVIGPLELADLSGVDLVFNVAKGGLYKSLDASDAPQKILRDMVNRKELGIKTGKGFYDWTGSKSADATIKLRDDHLVKILKERREAEN